MMSCNTKEQLGDKIKENKDTIVSILIKEV